MGKSKRDYRRASADNFDNYVPTEIRQSYGKRATRSEASADHFSRDDSGDKFSEHRRPQRRPRERVADPVAKDIAEFFAGQAAAFLAAPVEDREAASKELFRLDEYPSELNLGQGENASEEDGVKLYIYDLDRSVRIDRDNPEKLRHMSAAFVVNDIESGEPAYYAYARISPEGNYNVRVIPRTDKGPDYRSAAVVDSRDTKHASAEDQ